MTTTTGTAQFHEAGSSSAREVAVTLAPGVLRIGEEAAWPVVSLVFEESSVAGGPCRVRSQVAPGLLMVSDTALLNALGHRQRSASTALGTGLVMVAGGLIGLLAASYFLFLPWMAGFLARQLPVSIEQQMGRAALEEFAPVASRCDSEEIRKPVRAIVDRLTTSVPKLAYPFQVYIVKNNTVNAVALPGGYIVVFTGLLDKTRTPEELAAVLGHEIIHVTGHHGTTAVMRATVFWAMLSFLTGDPTSLLVGAASALSQLSYGRSQEEAADRGAMELFELVRADPKGLEGAFEMLSKERADLPGAARYFSTHPQIGDRLAAVRAWKAKVKYQPEPLVAAGAAWLPRGACIAQ
ncbi:MAG: M48 family metallopeptidase [Acidobacteria bacterium]|nr:M48 family metallopeptidase [Acidobacteriota bacterium]